MREEDTSAYGLKAQEPLWRDAGAFLGHLSAKGHPTCLSWRAEDPLLAVVLLLNSVQLSTRTFVDILADNPWRLCTRGKRGPTQRCYCQSNLILTFWFSFAANTGPPSHNRELWGCLQNLSPSTALEESLLLPLLDSQ